MDQQLINEVREVMKNQREVIELCLAVKDGFTSEAMAELVPALEAAGISDELIEGIKLFETN